MKSKQKHIPILAGLFSLIIFPILWLNSNGASGSMPLYSLFLFVILSYVLNGLWGRIIPLVFIAVTISLIVFEVLVPDFFEPYPDRNQIVINVLINLSVISALFFLLIYKISKHIDDIKQKLYLLSITDDLTDVYNRRYFISELEKHINRTRRHDMDFALIFLDVDDFKIINDTYGHNVGDDILKSLGRTIKKNLRNYDIGARYGGDEFLVLLPHTSVADAIRIAKRITNEFSNSIHEIIPNEITLAFGVISGENQALEDILIAADEKMYMNKVKKQNMK